MNDKHSQQKGSALLLTLGVLSLVLILAMSFAFTARTNRQIARINADQVKTYLLAESGLARVLGGMEFSLQGKIYPASETTPIGLNNHCVKSDESGDPDGLHYAWVGSTQSAGDEEKNSFESLVESHPLVKYINQYSQSGHKLELASAGFMTIRDDGDIPSGTDKGRIVGRVGALILEEGGKWDINQLLNRRPSGIVPFVKDGQARLQFFGSGTNVFAAAKDFYYPLASTYGTTGTISESNTMRFGLLPEEIRVPNKYYSKLQSGYDNLRLPWFSYENLFYALGNGLQDSGSNKMGTDIFAYTFFSAEEPESFIIELNGPEYARFDLTGYENGERTHSFYDSSDEPQCINNACTWYASSPDDASDLVSTLTASSGWVEFSNGESQDAIPFLSAIKGRTALGDESSGAVSLGKHVAANMIDFCDANSIATIPSDFSFDAASPSEPAYCGNEKVPYINEIAFALHVERVAMNEGQQYRYTLTLTPTVELVNIFNETLGCTAVDVRIIGEYTMHCGNGRGHGPHPANDAHQTFDQTLSAAGASLSAGNYGTITLPGHTLLNYIESYGGSTMSGETPVYLPPTVQIDFKITKVLGKLSNSEGICDLSYCEAEPSAVTLELTSSPADVDALYNASLQAYDPRCNHRANDWYWNEKGGQFLVNDEDEDTRTLDSNNEKAGSGFDLYSEIDKEDETFPRFSNAYIKNKPFESFWELGTIHRGEPYRTLRLAKYSPFSSGANIFYGDGDAAILDQLKIGPVRYSRGKYNANSRIYRNYAEVLFKGIKSSDGFSHTSTTYVETTPASLAKLVAASWEAPSLSRVASAAAMVPDSSDNDMEEECLIGKTANLLTTRCDAYTIILVAQALMEYDDQDTVSSQWSNSDFRSNLLNPTYYDSRYCSILGTKVLTVNLVRDAWTNKLTVVRKHYEDE